jgi:hypothetical protein
LGPQRQLCGFKRQHFYGADADGGRDADGVVVEKPFNRRERRVRGDFKEKTQRALITTSASNGFFKRKN